MIFFFFVIQSGRGFYIKFMMMNLANTAVRSCTLQQYPIDQSGATYPNHGPRIQACVQAAYADITANDYNLSRSCPSASASFTTINLAQSPESPANPLKLAQLTITCTLPYGAPGMPGGFNIRAQVAMPYFE